MQNLQVFEAWVLWAGEPWSVLKKYEFGPPKMQNLQVFEALASAGGETLECFGKV